MINQIKKALSVVVDKDGIDISVIDKFISLYEKKDASARSFLSGSSSDSYVFIRLKPVNFPSKKLFMSNIATDNAYEISVVPAIKDDNGEWVPNESCSYLKGLVSHRVIMESMFDSDQAGFHPFSITELDSVPVEFAKSELSNKDSYGSSFRKRVETINKSFNQVEESINHLIDNNLGFNKKNTEEVISDLSILMSNISSDFNFVLKNDASQFEQDIYEIKKEVQDSISAGIMRTGTALPSPDIGIGSHSRISDVFNCMCAGRDFQDVEKLLVRYADTLTEYKDSELKKDILRFAHGFSNPSILEELDKAHMGKGGISVSRPSASGIDLFGENRDFHNFYSLSFCFSCESQKHNGKVKIDEIYEFLELWLSPYQMMEIIQCSLSGTWVKATMSRICGLYPSSPSEDDDHETIKIDGDYHSDMAVECKEMILEAKGILGKSATNKSKARLTEIVSSLASLLEKESSHRQDAFESKQRALFNDYANKSKKDISAMISGIEDKHPEVFKNIQNLISNKY